MHSKASAKSQKDMCYEIEGVIYLNKGEETSLTNLYLLQMHVSYNIY